MIQVAVGLIFRNGNNEVLLCQRKPDLPYALKWEFPGGKVNNGERIEDCLKRELREELNISFKASKLYHRHSHTYSSGTFDVFYFMIHNYHGEPSNRAFQEIHWVPITELYHYDILKGNATVVQKLVNEYGKN